ncbi:DUF1648 domain-containing protein [Microbacterium sp. Marseille-Q6965]|uniref:DUF1648 domain-containing protein n=1 Tax=Microbacterium sp. Marseille-Q6965 TaxID=2965072 RepID=UPI0021B7566A|nr:DUF1648 domain-containing protein [Microbacterium sp. Marseille-Q6965]
MTTTLTGRAARRRYAIIALVIPLALQAVVLLAQLALVPLLPDPAASHWGFSGVPDGFTSPWLLPLVTAGTGIGVTLLVGLSPYLADAAPQDRRGRPMSYRLFAAVVWAETGFVGTLALATFLPQVGLDDARDALLPGWWALVGLGLAAVLALIAWKTVVEPPLVAQASETPAPIMLRGEEHAVWLKTVSMSRAGLGLVGVLLAVTLLTTGATLYAQLAAGAPVSGGLLLSVGVLILVALLVLTNTVFRVRIDDAGLDVRSPIGWPRVRIRRDRIRSATVVHVNPMGEYGGWGWRFSINAGWGVILRTGEAIRILRTDGRAFTVTVDDAETGAALLNGLIAREGANGDGPEETKR